jgi:Tol biopolymer transport system component
MLVQGLNVAGNLLDPTTSPDGSLLVFRHNMPGDDLYEASRVTPATFASPVAITNLNSASTVQPLLPLEGNEMVFSSSRTGGGDLYRTIRTGTTFSTPTQVTELSTANDEHDPVLAPDGLTLYFRSGRPASPGGYNIYVATRPTMSDPFGAAQLVPNVNSDADDGQSWISPDGCRLYISSARAGTNDIYVAMRTH